MTTTALRVRARPIPHGSPLVFSTGVAVEPWPSIVWDANGYYRALGVSSRATRRELREAYQRLDGQRSDYLTYVIHQLLDPDIRRVYDATPRGRIFLDDLVAEQMRRESAIQTSQERRMLWEQTGFVPDEQEMLDWDEVIGQTSTPSKPGSEDAEAERQDWSWGYYLRGVESLPDVTALQTWQRLLIEALARRGVAVEIAVGWCDTDFDVTPSPYRDRGDDMHIIAFCGTEPTEALAERVASLVTTTTAQEG